MKIKFIKKSVSRILLVITIISLINIPSSYAAVFSDVTSATQNQEAILYLQQKGIINGFPDGSFKPGNPVTRAEFLKIIIEGSNIPKDAESTSLPFSDIDSSLWYLPYVKKAFSAGWISGFNDGTFKPNNVVSKSEALKILGKAQAWDLSTINLENLSKSFPNLDISSWYAPYVSYAINHHFITEDGPDFDPNIFMTRSSISGLIYNTIKETTTSTQPATDNLPTNSSATQESTFTPIEYGTIEQTAYVNIHLDETLPNTFYKDEVYVISGTITSGSYDSATVILNEENGINKSTVGKVTNNHFNIPVHFKNSGNFYLGVLPGNNGNTLAKKISVLSDVPTLSNSNLSAPNAVKNIKVAYANGNTSVNFTPVENTVTKIVFLQNGKSVTYFSRQKENSIPVQYSDFENFSPGNVNYQVSMAYIESQKPLIISSTFSASQVSSLNATQHTFDDIIANEITTSPADTMSNPGIISFTGNGKIDLEIEAFVIKPDGFVDTVQLTTSGATTTYFNQNIIPSGNNFNFNYSTSTEGRYIVEINNKNSEPSISHPIYVGNIIPLIPDYSDLNVRQAFTGTLNLATERNKLLNLINKDRLNLGLKAVVLDNDLNTLAQAHSDDMKNNNYFSHYNLQNQTPQDRRIAMGITTPVGENIAKDTSTEFTHYDFMRSASHRQNVLNSYWTRVGIGIAVDGEYLLTTEEFSTSPITSNDLQNFHTQLVEAINNKRLNNNLVKLNTSSQLENVSQIINNSTIAGTTTTNSEFNNALNQNNFLGDAQLIGRVGDDWTKMMDSILNEDITILKNTWALIGVDIQTDKIGKIYTIVTLGSSN